jgi:hypothetical protein
VHIYPAITLHYWLSDDTICAGEKVVIELSENFEEYWWSTGGDGTRKEFEPEEDLHIVVEAIDSNGCEDRIEIDVEVIDCDTFCDEHLIEVWPDSVLCEGDSVNLEVKNGYADYDWSDGIDGRLRWVYESGWYVVDAETDEGQHCIDSVHIEFYESKELRIFSNPSRPVLCTGDSIVIEVNGGFVHYEWNTRHDGQRNVLYPEESFVLVIEALDSNGCVSRASLEITVDSCHSSIMDLESGNWKFYPNPCTDYLLISQRDASQIGAELILIDQVGKTVLSSKVSDLQSRLDLIGIDPGVYYLILGDHRFRIIKL